MKTLSLEQAAAWLFTTPDTVSECIRRHGLPAAKVGRAWVLVDVDVIDWIRKRYGERAACTSSKEQKMVLGGSTSVSTVRELDALLAPQTVGKRKNLPPRLRVITGGKRSSASARR